MNQLDRYVRSRQVDLAADIRGRKKIYLDIRFWIIARDAAAGASEEVEKGEMLSLLRRGVADGTLVCPISESTFIELMKQANTPTLRIATAVLIDELSLGVSLISSNMRIGTEIAHFIYTHSDRGNLYGMQDLVWTKLAYALGYMHPHMEMLDGETELRLQKGVLRCSVAGHAF